MSYGMQQRMSSDQRDALLRAALARLKARRTGVTFETLAQELEAIEKHMRERPGSGDSPELGAARKLLALRGEEETHESLCAAVDFLYPPRSGVVS